MSKKRNTWMRSYRVLGYRLVERTCPCGRIYNEHDKSAPFESYALAVSGADACELFDTFHGVQSARVHLLVHMITNLEILRRMRIRGGSGDGYDADCFCFMTDPEPVKG